MPPQITNQVDTSGVESLLLKILGATEGSFVQLCVSDREVPESRLSNFPTNGMCRYILRRTGDGGNYALAANSPLLLCEAKEYRLGGIISNAGANPVTLYFTEDLITPGTSTPLSGATPQLTLASNQMWKFGDFGFMWCGNVLANSPLGTTVTVADF